MWADICDAWIDELTTEVDALAGAVQHRYAPWSVEQLKAGLNEVHLAVWPEAEAEVTEPSTLGPQGSDLADQSFIVLLWEDASVDSARRIDDEDANRAWLELHEAVRARFFVMANTRLGQGPVGSVNIRRTRYTGGAFAIEGTVRVISARFVVQVDLTYS